MDELLKHDQINFQVLDNTFNVLQVILLPNQSLYTELTYMLYCSSVLSFREVSNPLWKRLVSEAVGLRYRVKNRKGGVEYVGLSKSTGKILGINPFVLEDTFIVNKAFILGYSSGVKITQALEPSILMKKEYWREAKGNGIVFLQGEGSVIEKRLGSEEEICVSKNEIMAFSKGVKITEANVVRSYRAFLVHDWCMMKIKGPGWVFIEGCGRSRVSRVSAARRNEIINLCLLFGLITMIICLEMIIKV